MVLTDSTGSRTKPVFITVGHCVVEASVPRKVGSIADYDPGATPALNSAYQPVGVGMRQRQEWEETVPMSSTTQCMFTSFFCYILLLQFPHTLSSNRQHSEINDCGG